MALPAWGWLTLRRVTGKRLPRRSDKEKWTGSGVEKKALSGKCQLALALAVGLSIRYDCALGSAQWGISV